jgi:hypothetical protein
MEDKMSLCEELKNDEGYKQLLMERVALTKNLTWLRESLGKWYIDNPRVDYSATYHEEQIEQGRRDLALCDQRINAYELLAMRRYLQVG